MFCMDVYLTRVFYQYRKVVDLKIGELTVGKITYCQALGDDLDPTWWKKRINPSKLSS